jgi:hypothetical protein
METTLYEVGLKDGRMFRIFCRGKNQKKRFKEKVEALKSEIAYSHELTNGIHTITEFEKLRE